MDSRLKHMLILITNHEHRTHDGHEGNLTVREAAEQGFLFDFECGEIIAYLGNEEDVVIPRSIAGVEVVAVGQHAFSNKNIRTVKTTSRLLVARHHSFSNNLITSVDTEGTLTIFVPHAFEDNPITWGEH